ncbi:MAG TPA: class II aldolase/adducin family protein [Beijerinckiaceae bacterium]|nr:class II aldolase/adducin family protein [Beijerinckiaceae bacterium]
MSTATTTATPGASSSQNKRQLAHAIRMLERAEIVDYNGHCSLRAGSDSILINSGACVRSTLSEDDIVEIDFDGRLIGAGRPPPLEFHIHTEIYRARPDVCAIAHTHPKWSTFLTMVGAPYRPVYAQGVLLGDIPVFDSPMSINSKPMGERLAQTLGKGPAVLLKSHGVTVAAADVEECFALAVYLEDNAHRQYMAMQIGKPYEFSVEEQRACREKLWSKSLFRRTWDYYDSKL